MARRQLRLYSTEDAAAVRPGPAAETRVALRDLLPLVTAAQRANLIWLRDFLDDEVMVTSDLYEVLQAFKTCRQTG